MLPFCGSLFPMLLIWTLYTSPFQCHSARDQFKKMVANAALLCNHLNPLTACTIIPSIYGRVLYPCHWTGLYSEYAAVYSYLGVNPTEQSRTCFWVHVYRIRHPNMTVNDLKRPSNCGMFSSLIFLNWQQPRMCLDWDRNESDNASIGCLCVIIYFSQRCFNLLKVDSVTFTFLLVWVPWANLFLLHLSFPPKSLLWCFQCHNSPVRQLKLSEWVPLAKSWYMPL